MDNQKEKGKEKSIEDCYYFLYSNCKLGEKNCTYRHHEMSKQCNILCEAWANNNGKCREDCPLRHSKYHVTKTREVDWCYWEERGGCLKGFCEFKHKDSTKDEWKFGKIKKIEIIKKEKNEKLQNQMFPVGGNNNYNNNSTSNSTSTSNNNYNNNSISNSTSNNNSTSSGGNLLNEEVDLEKFEEERLQKRIKKRESGIIRNTERLNVFILRKIIDKNFTEKEEIYSCELIDDLKGQIEKVYEEILNIKKSHFTNKEL